uniref:BPI1 domain-containing protein n=1 Tax=Strongyloides venezuelensis TaxID=75913 RepID=A0A0K0EVR6_STRVS
MVAIFLNIQSLNIYLAFNLINVNGNTIPGAQIQFSSVGLNYMSGVAIDYINSAIAEVNMSDIEGFLKFTYHLSQIKIKEFNILNLQMSFNSLHLINLVSIYRKYQEKCQLIINCTANFNIFDIKLHGSLPDDMNDLFRKEIEKHFKEKIEVICQVIERVESDQDVWLTGTFEGFYTYYAPTSNPESSTTSFTIPIRSYIL